MAVVAGPASSSFQPQACTDTILLASLLAATKSLDDVRQFIPQSLTFTIVLCIKTNTIIVVATDDNINCTLSPSLSTQ